MVYYIALWYIILSSNMLIRIQQGTNIKCVITFHVLLPSIKFSEYKLLIEQESQIMLAKQHHDMLMFKKKADEKKDADVAFTECWTVLCSRKISGVFSNSKPVKAWNMVHLRAICSKFKIYGYKNRICGRLRAQHQWNENVVSTKKIRNKGRNFTSYLKCFLRFDDYPIRRSWSVL